MIVLRQVIKKKSNLFNIVNSNIKNKDNLFIILREKTVLEPEKTLQIEIKSLGVDSILGNWRFNYVWQGNNSNKDSLFCSLLRAFSANLEIRKNPTHEDPFQLFLITSIKLGILSIQFSGVGAL